MTSSTIIADSCGLLIADNGLLGIVAADFSRDIRRSRIEDSAARYCAN